MSKIYVFGIGGTGSRVLRSLTMMLASGVKLGPGVDKIVPIIIDPDNANADLTRAVDLMNKYSEIRKQLKFTEGAQSTFFKTEIEKILKNYTLPFQNIGDTSFESFIDISNLSIEDQAFTRMLFSEKNLSSKMDVGFKGNPNIGSVVLNQIFESDGFSDFANTFGQGDRIFIISSIFGGTGAAGFPMLLKTLRTSDWFNNSDVINKSNIGAVTILPYFKVSNDINQENEINSATFISKARSALAYYEKNISNNDTIDSLYFLADTPSKVYQYSVGGNTQKNDAHMIEFMAATAIVDFTFKELRDPDEPIQTENYELGIRDVSGDVNFTTLYDGLSDRLYEPLTQFIMMGNALKDDFAFLKDSLAVTRPVNSELYGSSFMKNLRNYTTEYEKWLTEMAGNDRSLRLFNVDCKDKPFEVVNGVQEKKKFFEKNKNYNLFHARLGKKGEEARKFVTDSNPSFFLEMFYRATKSLIEEKLNK